MSLPAQVSASKYVSVYGIDGVEKVIEIPNGRCVFVFDGQDIRFVDGTDALPLLLPNLEKQEGGDFPYIIGVSAAGQLLRFTREAGATGTLILKNVGGVIKWLAESSANGVPEDGIGLLRRSADGAVEFVGSASAKGIYRIDGSGGIQIVEEGSSGTVLQMGAAGPYFGNLGSGVASGGGATTGLDGVTANNTSASIINIKCPKITVDDGAGTEETLTLVNENIDITNPAGVAGIDTGAVTNSTWYHYYIISDGANVGAIFSLSDTTPDLTAAVGYDKYVYAGCFYVQSDGTIRDFYQKGREFWTETVEWGTNLNLGTSFASIVGGVNLNTILPPNTKKCKGAAGGSSTTAVTIMLAATSSGLAQRIVSVTESIGTAGGTFSGTYGFGAAHGRFEDMLITNGASPVLYWKGLAVSTGKARIIIDGYTI